MEKLLIIGEELINDERVESFLEREGFEILKTKDSLQGLDIVTTEKPSIVIVDHKLKDGDGLQVLRNVLEIDRACEVILVTPGGEINVAIEVLRAGALDYLRRPIDLEQLGIALGRAYERRNQRKSAEAPSILVLEDHEPTLKRLVRILEKEGYRVESAPDGEKGLQLFHKKRFDMILADVRMPLKDGLSVLRETKGSGADVEVIVTTGYGDEEVVVEALREGAANFIRKPVDIEQMLLAIQKALDFQTTRRSLAYRNRDVELMQDLVVRLNKKLELIVETPGKLTDETRQFLYQLVDALPIGVVIAGADRRIIYANHHVVKAIGESPTKLSTECLSKLGVNQVTEDQLIRLFGKAVNANPGAVETVFISKWSFLVMTPMKMVRPDGTEKFVALAIRGERQPRKDS